MSERLSAMRLSKSIVSIFILLLIGSAQAQSRRAADDQKQKAVQAFEEGQNAQERGDLDSAVRYYTNAISADATLFQAYYQRAVALLTLTRISEAEADFRKVIELKPDFARAHRGLGLALLDQNKTDEAKPQLSRAIELDPKITGVRIYLASAMIKSGENTEAIAVLQTAIAQGETDSLAHALLGVALERAGKTDEALDHYSRAVQMEANNATAREGLARIAESRGDMARAIEEYSLAYRAQPSFDLAVKLADLLARAGRLQAAIQLYRGLLTERPNDLNIRLEMFRLMAENGQGEDALMELEKLIAGQAANSKLLALAGDLCFEDKPDMAVSYYARAVEADQSDNRARVQWGASLVRAMQFEEAVRVLSDSAAREPDNYAARANLATAFFKLKQYPQAAREFIWIVQRRPDVAASYYFLAISFDRIGDCVQATRAYQEFVRRADATLNKNEVEEANIRLALLSRLAKDGKCKSLVKEKKR